jgi:hypothetical protein
VTVRGEPALGPILLADDPYGAYLSVVGAIRGFCESTR